MTTEEIISIEIKTKKIIPTLLSHSSIWRNANVHVFLNMSLHVVYIFLCFFYKLETGGITISPRPSEEGAEILPAMPMRPFFGIKPALVDKNVSLFSCNLFIFHKV